MRSRNVIGKLGFWYQTMSAHCQVIGNACTCSPLRAARAGEIVDIRFRVSGMLLDAAQQHGLAAFWAFWRLLINFFVWWRPDGSARRRSIREDAEAPAAHQL